MGSMANIPNMLSISQLDTTAPVSPILLVTCSRITRRSAPCSMMDMSLAPVKKKLIQAISVINDSNPITIPTINWNFRLLRNSNADNTNGVLLSFFFVVLVRGVPATGRVGLVAINQSLFHS